MTSTLGRGIRDMGIVDQAGMSAKQVAVGMKTVNLVGWMVLVVAVSLANAQGEERPKSADFSRPFEPDEHTVVLYQFDEGKGE